MYQFDQFNQPELFRIPKESIHNERPPPLPPSLAQSLPKSREDQYPLFDPRPVLLQYLMQLAPEELRLELLTEYN
jgi:hypothetical protein